MAEEYELIHEQHERWKLEAQLDNIERVCRGEDIASHMRELPAVAAVIRLQSTIAELREAVKIARQRGIEEERERCVSCCHRLADGALKRGYDPLGERFAFLVAAREIGRGEKENRRQV
jgi:hypothetical protein